MGPDCAFSPTATELFELPPETAASDTPAQPSDALSILQKAIEVVSDVLKLKIANGTTHLKVERSTQEMKELCAELLCALKGITGLLGNAVAADQAVDMRGTTLDASQAAVMEKALLTEVFHIELALSMVEGGGDVAGMVAQKRSLPTGGGLIRAQAPAAVTMPASHIKQILDGGAAEEREKIEALLAKLAEAVRTQSASGKPAAPDSSMKTTGAEAQEIGPKQADCGKKTPDAGELDAKVLRMLLKIDKTEIENTQAALQNEKLDLPKIAATLFAKKPGLLRSARGDGLDAALQAAAGTKGTQSGVFDPAKALSIPKTVEESVLTQLSARLSEAVKTGVTEIRLLLRPESLGEMRVKLTLDGDVVMGKIYVENQQVKHIVEANLQSLRDSLGYHGLQAGSFDVNVGGDAREHMNDAARGVAPRAESEEDGRDPSGNAETPASASLGSETGRRFGSNTIEFFA